MVEEINALSRPNTISVNKIDVGVDQRVLKELKKLADLQRSDPKLRIVRDKFVNNPADKRHTIEREVLFRKDSRGAKWKAMLPECLELPVPGRRN